MFDSWTRKIILNNFVDSTKVKSMAFWTYRYGYKNKESKASVTDQPNKTSNKVVILPWIGFLCIVKEDIRV